MVVQVTKAPMEKLAAPIQPKPLNEPSQQTEVQPDGTEVPVKQTAWQDSRLLVELWPAGQPLWKSMGKAKTAEAWMYNHSQVAEAWSIVLDAFKVPCPPADQIDGSLVAAAVAIVAWSNVMMRALKEDSHGNKQQNVESGGPALISQQECQVLAAEQRTEQSNVQEPDSGKPKGNASAADPVGSTVPAESSKQS